MARPKLQDQQRAHLAAAAPRAIITHGLANVRIRDNERCRVGDTPVSVRGW
ncbi:hypothetical protein [Micromonospora purpureochromogenes]|uniref:Uncharacterized protein n=1 Tax=Micromonospora purpureochromogenes TaxID=47872 RepID=A0ABX2RV67_9ACTN|nr:hypothetical protein [Micromonospora purpureochromogenes]NYF59920.1 hypothetical protein [Micromonospora purpureochromogenes]